MQKKRIMIVDDERAWTTVVKAVLEASGDFDVRTENCPEDALAAAREFQPHLLLLDVFMPRMSGGDVAARLQADGQFQETPIMFVTGAIRKSVVADHGGRIGSHFFLAKPVTSQELLGSVRNCLPA